MDYKTTTNHIDQLSGAGLISNPTDSFSHIDQLSGTGLISNPTDSFDHMDQLLTGTGQISGNTSYGLLLEQLSQASPSSQYQIKLNEKMFDDIEALDGEALIKFNPVTNSLSQNEENQRYTMNTTGQKPINQIASVSQTLANPNDNQRPSNNDIAIWLTEHFKFTVINDVLYVYDPHAGFFRELNNGQRSDHFIRAAVPDEYKCHISNYTNREAVNWLLSMPDLKASATVLEERKNYVLFKDCVVDIEKNEILDFSPNFHFTSRINANYFNKGQNGEEFENFISTITQDDQELYDRLQELFGYVISQLRDLKVIPYLIGPKDSGKSIILKLLTHIVGEEFTSEISMEEFNDERYLNQLVGKRLNVCAEITEVPLKKLDTLKKLSGGDALLVRSLYQDARRFRNEAVLFFAGNDLPIVKRGHDRSNAFFERLLLVPFQYQVPKEEQDISLLYKLLKETDYIAKWALAGLQRLCRNNFCFTPIDSEDEILMQYSDQFSHSSIDQFINECCELGPKFKCFSVDLYQAYESHCELNEITPKSTTVFHNYLQTTYRLSHKRARIGPDNRRAYIGIRLHLEKYSSTDQELTSDCTMDAYVQALDSIRNNKESSHTNRIYI